MEFRILGPLEVSRDGEAIALGGAKQRAMLAILLLEANKVLRVERLAELLWGSQAPATAGHAIEVYVSHLRHALEPEGAPYRILLTGPAGYTLNIEPDTLDAVRFQQLVESATQLGPKARLDQLKQALALWRGPALAEFSSQPFAVGAAARLDDLRLHAVEERIDAELDLGRHPALVGELVALVSDHPTRERLCGQLMLALYRCGRQAEASDVYQRTRDRLVDELGMEPGPELQVLLKRILQQDPALIVGRPNANVLGREASLPLPPTPLIGREVEVRAVADLLLSPEIRLVSLIGPGGVGKTRLGLQVAQELLGSFGDGVAWVSLASVFEPRVVPSAVAQAIGAHIEPDRPPTETVIDALRDREALLVLDNFEQVVEASPLVASLLMKCSRLKVMLTTRRALRIASEHEYPVSPLAVPSSSTSATYVETVDAVRLFVDRARAVKPNFAINDGNASAVAEICQRLDGLPLAIELAAARIRILQPSAIISRIRQSLDLLAATAHDAPQRQKTLRATIDWSYRLLDKSEQTFLRRLGVFRGGWTLDAAASIVGEIDGDIVDMHDSLAANSLIRVVDDASESRFLLLETIRDYCMEQLQAEGEATEISNRHARFFTDTVFHAFIEIHGPKQVIWLERLESEIDNLRAARAWMYLQAEQGDVTALTGGLLLAAMSWWHSHIRGYHAELLAAIESLLSLPGIGTAPAEARGPALVVAGIACYFIGRFDAAMNYSFASREFVKDDFLTFSLAMAIEAQVHLQRGEVGPAQELWSQLRAMLEPHEAEKYDDLNTAWVFAWAVLFSAVTEMAAGNVSTATPMVLDARSQFESMGDIHGSAWGTYAMATLALLGGEPESAKEGYAQSLELFRGLGDRPNEAMVMEGFGDVAVNAGEFSEAASWFARALDVYREMGSRRGQGMTLEGYATLAERQGDLERALMLAGAAQTARGTSGMAIELFPRQRPLFDHLVRLAETDPKHNAVLLAGRSLTLDQAIALATSAAADKAATMS